MQSVSSLPSLADRPEDVVTPWLDHAVRQCIVELALAGAHHGMKAEARVILRALPSLVPQREARQCLNAALLIALGDTSAARDCLAELVARGETDVPTANVLRHWLDATDAVQSRPGAALSSPASPSSPSLSSASFPPTPTTPTTPPTSSPPSLLVPSS
ncbi:DUF1039 domain-containing protein [Pandoraea anhela]|uniref:DUF1039 domain-containing protein n=1 Tax=Pandoraea anhela TaxID=2508295 RepID=UPI0035205EA0